MQIFFISFWDLNRSNPSLSVMQEIVHFYIWERIISPFKYYHYRNDNKTQTDKNFNLSTGPWTLMQVILIFSSLPHITAFQIYRIKIGLNNMLKITTVQYVECLVACRIHVSRWITKARELKCPGMMGENTTQWWLSDASNKNSNSSRAQSTSIFS